MGRKSKRRGETMRTIWKAQGKGCAICGVHMMPVHKKHPRRGWTFEHVYNHASDRFHSEGNRLVTHVECNNAKADREPYPCEVLLLHAVNARLGLELTPRLKSWRDEKQGLSKLALELIRVNFGRRIVGAPLLTEEDYGTPQWREWQ
jgi:hypothetical protein